MAVALVKVKQKHQVTLPASVRREAGIDVGDLLEAKVEKGKITLAPKSVLDKHLAESIQDIKEGRFYGPFKTGEELIRSLHRNAKRLKNR